jgi:ElaB/YqjD/DUF883 family membrane-anchored ribosome-binding protein
MFRLSSAYRFFTSLMRTSNSNDYFNHQLLGAFMISVTKDDNISSLKSSAQNFRTAANDIAEDTKTDLRNAAGKAGRRVRDLISTASDEVSHAKDTVTTQIRTNPVQSSMIALGVGFVIGALFRR